MDKAEYVDIVRVRNALANVFNMEKVDLESSSKPVWMPQSPLRLRARRVAEAEIVAPRPVAGDCLHRAGTV